MKTRFTKFYQLIIAVSFVFIVSSCKNETGVSIKGEVVGVEGSATVQLLQQEFDRILHVDSVKVGPKKKSFRFKVKSIQEPTFYQLKVNSGKSRTLILLAESGDEIELNIDINNFSNYQVEGSEGSLRTKMLSDKLNETKAKLDSVNQLIQLSSNEFEKKSFSKEIDQIIEQQRSFSTQFIMDNPMSRASVMAVYQQIGTNQFVFDRLEDVQLLKIVATSLKALYPESGYTKGMLADIKRQEQRIANLALSKMVEQAEAALPEIALPNIKGDTVKLSSLRGKVILLDFWASFNQTCLLENQEYKSIYTMYHPKGFEIFQVSVDTKKEDWVSRIQSTNLPWINVSELDPSGSYVARIYNVTQIPANYLINRDFEIVGKNLYGKELERKIKELI